MASCTRIYGNSKMGKTAANSGHYNTFRMPYGEKGVRVTALSLPKPRRASKDSATPAAPRTQAPPNAAGSTSTSPPPRRGNAHHTRGARRAAVRGKAQAPRQSSEGGPATGALPCVQYERGGRCYTLHGNGGEVTGAEQLVVLLGETSYYSVYIQLYNVMYCIEQ